MHKTSKKPLKNQWLFIITLFTTLNQYDIIKLVKIREVKRLNQILNVEDNNNNSKKEKIKKRKEPKIRNSGPIEIN